ncbi:hypothetical protein B1R94_13525 [Mycolicibacterium litorale]|nr:hypothetical protein B1R94_13525 [Mycolicibacterium litorale]
MAAAVALQLAVGGSAHAESSGSCFAPAFMNNFGIPIAATPSRWVNPSCEGPQSGRRCAWTQLPSSGCINFPPAVGSISPAREQR